MQITRGKMEKPLKTLIYGPEGIGKTTLASQFPDPVFIDTEGSTNFMDVARLPAPSSWMHLTGEVQYVKDHPDVCRTLVIDTADWAEKLCIEDVCCKKRVDGIEGVGYGRGYVYVKESFGKLLNLLSDLTDKGINVVMTAHAQMRKFEQPDELGAYDRWEMKLSKQVAPIVKEWADMLLFCNYKTMVVNVDNQGAQKGKNKAQGGKRVMYTTHHACWDAKNRFGLPDELDMNYNSIRPVVEYAGGKAATPEPTPKQTQPASPHAPAQPAGTTMKRDAPQNPDGSQMSLADLAQKEDPIASAVRMTPEEAKKALAEEKPPASAPGKTEPAPAPAVSRYFSNPDNLPKKLKDLMEQDNICEWDIQAIACDMQGYFPPNTLIENMEKTQPGFIEGWIIGCWNIIKEKVKEIKEKQEIPFL